MKENLKEDPIESIFNELTEINEIMSLAKEHADKQDKRILDLELWVTAFSNEFIGLKDALKIARDEGSI